MSIRTFLKLWRNRESVQPTPQDTHEGPQRHEEGLLDMTLAELAETGRFLRFRSRLLKDDFYLVANKSLKSSLPDQTLVVYTAGEMRKLLLFDPGKQDLILFHELKKRFGVEIEN